jgi:hypothetical protein
MLLLPMVQKSTLFALLMVGVFATANGQREGSRRGSDLHDEKLDDPYLPNAFLNQKTSPGYRYDGIGFSKTATVQVFTRQVNVDSLGNNILGDAANEPSIAVNPLDANQIVIGWRQFDNVASNFRQAGWGYSADGGQSWHFPGKLEPGIFRSDPVLDFDAAGNFYYNSLTNNPDYYCKVFESTNGGMTWGSGLPAAGGDKAWMAIDRTSGLGAGNIYSAWSPYASPCAPNGFTRSTDGNMSYEACSYIPGEIFWGTLKVGGNGELYQCGGSANFPNLQAVVKSTNAQVAGSVVQWNAPVGVDLDGLLSANKRVNPGGLLGQLFVDVDISGGLGDGNVYLLASLARISVPDAGDVMFARSRDGGATWDAAIKVNDDMRLSNVQWFGTMAVAPDGRIDAAWLDTRDHWRSDSSALYYAYSTNQGSSWSANERLSAVFDPHQGYPNQEKMGDYFDIVSTDAGAHLSWANTLNGEQDVYYSFIVPPVAVGTAAPAALPVFTLSPNPCRGELVVQTSNSGSGMTVFNLLGEAVLSLPLQMGTTTVEVAALPAGMYVVRVVGRNGAVATKKLIRE